MSLVCRNCSRVNPPEAHYCYWDGAVLDGRAQSSGPIAVGAQPFHNPFFFPSGRQCRNFDELVLACYGDWKEALDLLREGYLEGFFGGMGRADLALAAKQAVKVADPDRGLDQLLNKLPCGTREPPKLFAQPSEVNLGQISRGADRQFVLHIENQGMGLLQGTIACDDTAWLMLGEGSGSPRKVFQCLSDFKLPVQVHGKALRARNKPLEGRLTIESNGGATVIVVRAEVPVQPFPDGVLAGAISPRQVAEKAKVNPKGAAPAFEKGAVAAWYESNGWIYPVQGPPSSGLGAIQQFFEALGLVKAPVVEISETAINLQGPPGASLEHVLQVRAQEKRPVFAHATTGAPWLQMGRVILEGRTARIPLKVPSVPARPGDQLQGKVQVTANGGQRFLVEVSLTITGRISAHVDRLPAAGVLDMDQVMPAVPVLTTADVVAETETIPEVVAVNVEVVSVEPPGRHDILNAMTVAIPGGQHGKRNGGRGDDFEGKVARIGEQPSGGFLKHLMPLGILALLLFIVLAHDLWIILRNPTHDEGADTGLLDSNPRLLIHFHDKRDEVLELPTMRFGLLAKDVKHPDRPPKKLTFDEHGRSNNTVVRLDDKEYRFGEPPGEWIEMKGKLEGATEGRPRDGLESSWFLPDGKLKVTQEVEIVAGTQSRLLDTCLVRYILKNGDTRAHRVGIRFMLDTFIGANDGVPFTVPGKKNFVDTKATFTQKDIPDYIEAIENPNDPQNPGTVARLCLRHFNLPKIDLEDMDKLLICRFPAGNPNAGWDISPVESMKPDSKDDKKEKGDSCVVMYWPYKDLDPGEVRHVAFTYGLGSLEIGGALALSVPSSVQPNSEFVVTAYVWDADKGDKVKLIVPSGLRLAGGESAEKTI
ncbi:MAG: hypothetical protein ACRELG_12750, partial [Gemmataceae bacterium]